MRPKIEDERTRVLLTLSIYVFVSFFTLLAASFLGFRRSRSFQDTLTLCAFLLPIALFYPHMSYIGAEVDITPLPRGRKQIQWSLIAFLLAMTVRGISICLFNVPLEKVAVTYLMYFLLTLIYGLQPSSIGFTLKRLKRNFLLGSIVCIGLFIGLRAADTLVYSLLTQASVKLWLRLTPLKVLDALLFHYICVAVSEELLFRGLIQTSIMGEKGFQKALMFSSFLFGCWHLLWGIPRIGLYPAAQVIEYSVSYMIFSTFWGVVAGSLYQQTRHLGSTIAMHGLWNVLSSTILISYSPGKPVTGNTWLQILFARHILQGMIALTFVLVLVRKVKREFYSPIQP